MVFLLSNLLAACKIRSELESEAKVQPVDSLSSSSTTMTRTKDQSDEEAESLTVRVLEIHGQLEARGGEDLKPVKAVNALFIDLVGICIKTISETVTNKVLNDTRIITILPSLHRLCAAAECHLESHWAKYISGANAPTSEQARSRLMQFPYYINYIDLTRMELSALNSLTTASCTALRKFAFIGSGPLPLTSLCIYQTATSFLHPGAPAMPENTNTNTVEVLNIDMDPQAISDSKRVCELLGSSASGMRFQCAAADAPDLDLASFDVVYLAALVGSGQAAKELLLESVVGRMRTGAYLVIRSAERLRRLLYADFDPTTEKVLSCLDICLAIHPYNLVVNSLIIGRVRGLPA